MTCTIILWDELTEEIESSEIDTPLDATNEQLIATAKEIYGDTEQDDWAMVSIARTPRTAIIEWESDRGHLATTQFNWC